MREPLGEDDLGFARECLHRTVELAREAAGRVLATRLHEARELLSRLVCIRHGRPLDGPRHLLDVPALHVLEAGADALRGLHLLALDLLHELLLPAAHALLELVQRTPALGRLALDLGARVREHLLERLLELRARANDALALCVVVGCEPLGIGLAARARVSGAVPLAACALHPPPLRP